ncbi:glycosyltransferase [Salarchaeum japonicum]|uniref:glycosyltransferase n=1 Tax=Salarchaeum japonicum TaxID=555573 RepID=UPI003C77EFEA
MEVKTVDEQGTSVGRLVAYVGVVAAFLVFVLAPGVVSVPYRRWLKTILLVVIFVQLARLAASTLASYPEVSDPPDLDVPDADLPSVSVVIPAYNEAAVLPSTLDACRAVDYPEDRLEIVVCYESDCTDGTADIVESAAAADDRIVALERDEPGGGKAAAANYAIERASGDIIASIDADHEFAPDAIRRAVTWFVAEPETWCVKGRCYGHNPTDSLVALYATVDRHIVEKVELFARELFGGFRLFGGGQAFFRSKVFEEIGPFDEEILVEDIDMSAKLHANGKRIRMDPGVVTYEEQPTTLSAWWSQRKRWARGWLQVSVRHFSSVLRSNNPTRVAKADAAQTFGYTMLTPFLVVGLPLPLFDVAGAHASAYIPYSEILWTIMGVFPVAAALAVFAADRRDGYSHHPAEYVVALTMGAYMVVNSVVYVVAFIEEFVLDKPSVYVTTTRADDDPAD